MEDQEIELLQKQYDTRYNKEWRLRQSDWHSKRNFYDYCDKYRKYFKHLLNGNIENNWSDVYSKISKKIPPLVRQHLVDVYVYFPDRNGKYKNFFNPEIPAYWRDEFYVTTDGILKVNRLKRFRYKPLYTKVIKKKSSPKLDPLFKFDYDVEITRYDKKFKRLFQKAYSHIYITTSTSINEKGETVEHKTRFTKDQFIEWAERHKKTYRIKIKDSAIGYYTLETITKTSYDE